MILLRLLTTESKPILSFIKISNLFDLKARQDSNNYYREFLASEEDFGDFLKRKRRLGEAYPFIESQVLKSPFLSISEHFVTFTNNYPKYKMSRPTFKSYYDNIPASKLKDANDKYLQKGNISYNKVKIIREIIREDPLTNQSKRKIEAVFPEESKESNSEKKQIYLNYKEVLGRYSLQLLIVYLSSCGVSFDVLSYLFGVSKSTIHNWFYTLGSIKQMILDSIIGWSGEICVDEKWVKISGVWHYVLSVVDNKTGFPLYYTITTGIFSKSPCRL